MSRDDVIRDELRLRARARVSAVVAAAENDVIGANGRLPWYLPEDLRHFARLTRGHVVVAGRRTHASVVERLGRPLDGRVTVVATRSPGLPEFDTVVYRSSVRAALSTALAFEDFAAGRADGEVLARQDGDRQDGDRHDGGREVFVIGGAEVYAQLSGDLDRVYLTRVHATVDGDVTLPSGWLDGFTLSEQVAGTRTARTGGDEIAYSFERYDRPVAG